MTEKNLRMLLLVDIVGFLSLVSLSLVPKCFWALSPSALINTRELASTFTKFSKPRPRITTLRLLGAEPHQDWHGGLCPAASSPSAVRGTSQQEQVPIYSHKMTTRICQQDWETFQARDLGKFLCHAC